MQGKGHVLHAHDAVVGREREGCTCGDEGRVAHLQLGVVREGMPVHVPILGLQSPRGYVIIVNSSTM